MELYCNIWSYNMVPYCTVLYGMVSCMVYQYTSMEWYGMTCYGMVWYDMALHGMAWYGMV